jgi:hypothetical protein
VIIKALRDKRAEIHGQIAAYHAQIAQAKARPSVAGLARR